MNAHELLKYNIELTHGVTKAYLSDMSEDDLFVRAVDGSNHIAWQLGHLIASETHMLTQIGGQPPALPEGFAAAHGKEATGDDDRSHFKSKDEYLAMLEALHESAKALVDSMTEEDFAKPGPEPMREFFPTVGSILLLTGSHEMMHSGQIATIRRKLGKPVVI